MTNIDLKGINFPEECPMTLSELIEQLWDIKARLGDISVYVLCRDSGGSYNELDTPYIMIDENKKVVTL